MVQDGYESFGKIEQMLGPNAIDRPWDLVFPDFAGGQLWKFLESAPEREEQFGRAMKSLEGLGGKSMAADVPFHRFDRFIDIGGSLGHFLHKVMKNNPKSKGILFDRPEVIQNTHKLWFNQDGEFNKDNGSAHERLELSSGDFFRTDDLPDAKDGDVFIMRYILHDWSEEDCLKILSGLHQKMNGTKSSLMIGECAIPGKSGRRRRAYIRCICILTLQNMYFIILYAIRSTSDWFANYA